MIVTADKYGVGPNATVVKKLFAGWYRYSVTTPSVNTQGENGSCSFECKDYAALLFPTYKFEDSSGSAGATKYVVHRATGRVAEIKPDSVPHQLHLSDNVIRKHKSGFFVRKDKLVVVTDLKQTTRWRQSPAAINTASRHQPTHLRLPDARQLPLRSLRTL
ncbi:hypothetical protein BAUCODRAFT_39419 [Baudoinia panamericana UAMH 10762]|uniref:Uncharacterized protein n=1 Tax=Baudoinia panamericana (strain UAMH 10762) TaxID=717646 RepID=M2MJ07_BAUPA|nr:uncharacterized protein BAUCODRAFT_39419 [Baudoinia panamericana UAMH 10762]EMC91258.1 hypothetical protein BAUCODRAFT_39419 [Baudoinia panamericana UAMH 10762]